MLALPPLRQVASPNYSSRGGARVSKIVAHDCEGSYAGSIGWFAQARSQVSAHLVLRDDGGEATQMVEFANKAWHVCAFNPTTIGVEMAGFASKGFAAPEWGAAAAIFAFLLRRCGLPCQWARGGVGDGFCSHHDLGAVGGGHTDPCEVGAPVWASFVSLVQAAYVQPMPDAWNGPASRPGSATTPTIPAMPDGFISNPTVRHDLLAGSLEWAQARLNALGVAHPPLIVDGLMGAATERAVAAFQGARGLYVDGDPGPKTLRALEAA